MAGAVFLITFFTSNSLVPIILQLFVAKFDLDKNVKKIYISKLEKNFKNSKKPKLEYIFLWPQSIKQNSTLKMIS